MGRKRLPCVAFIVLGLLFLSTPCFSQDSLAEAKFEIPLSAASMDSQLFPHWYVYFLPEGGCARAIVNAIRQAKRSILIQACSFTSYSIAQALIDAMKRGVKVEAIFDKKQIHERKTKIGLIAKEGVAVYLDGLHAIAHNKVIIIDSNTVITGSFNFTDTAEEQNAENLLIIGNTALASAYTNNWITHKTHWERYQILKSNKLNISSR